MKSLLKSKKQAVNRKLVDKNDLLPPSDEKEFDLQENSEEYNAHRPELIAARADLLNHNKELSKIKKEMQILKRNQKELLPEDIFRSTLNLYIENAQVLQNKGLVKNPYEEELDQTMTEAEEQQLDDGEEESQHQPDVRVVDDYQQSVEEQSQGLEERKLTQKQVQGKKRWFDISPEDIYDVSASVQKEFEKSKKEKQGKI